MISSTLHALSDHIPGISPGKAAGTREKMLMIMKQGRRAG
jgi:hypothetical protein